MYIYIYIYIVIQRQTVSLYHNSSVWLDTLQARIETHLTLHQANGIPLIQAYDSTLPRELTHMYQISFVYILHHRIPKYSIRQKNYIYNSPLFKDEKNYIPAKGLII